MKILKNSYFIMIWLVLAIVGCTVVACCLDNEGQLALGNVFESDIQSILTSQRAQNIACGFSNHTAVEPLCQSCQFATKFN